jgi:aspartate aminotransferase-like enzyme
MAEALIHHRGPEFTEIFRDAHEGLKWLFGTAQPVLALTCSGTGAFEAGIANFTSRGHRQLAIGGGKFGERWSEIGRAYGLDVTDFDLEWGDAADPDAVGAAIDEMGGVELVSWCASETSTGVRHPTEELVRVIRDIAPEALIAVDGITAVGVEPLPMDELDIDMLVCGSQKAFGLPPGLGFIAASDRAWSRTKDCDHPRYYFDLERERAKQTSGTTAFTPALTIVIGLAEVLRDMQQEGLEAIYTRHHRLAEATRAGVEALGLKLLPKSPANSVTAALVPEGVDAPAVVKRMRDTYGVTIAGGQAELKPRLIRIGHLGFYDAPDILIALAALERALADVGFPVAFGSALTAAQSIFTADYK